MSYRHKQLPVALSLASAPLMSLNSFSRLNCLVLKLELQLKREIQALIYQSLVPYQTEIEGHEMLYLERIFKKIKKIY